MKIFQQGWLALQVESHVLAPVRRCGARPERCREQHDEWSIRAVVQVPVRADVV